MVRRIVTSGSSGVLKARELATKTKTFDAKVAGIGLGFNQRRGAVDWGECGRR